MYLNDTWNELPQMCPEEDKTTSAAATVVQNFYIQFAEKTSPHQKRLPITKLTSYRQIAVAKLRLL